MKTNDYLTFPGSRRVHDLVKIEECEGGCVDHGGHKGDVLVTEVQGVDGKDWGLFSYCETARLIDKQRGLTVAARTECETCDSTGRIAVVNKWNVDPGSMWQRNFEEHGEDECPDCDGLGYKSGGVVGSG